MSKRTICWCIVLALVFVVSVMFPLVGWIISTVCIGLLIRAYIVHKGWTL